ncbi:TetR/AcrR family transcriptional regulator [Desulfatibacillum aliphaticivorans]|uniref:TetR/AcrR family transcriptional regulator n=1 Tax=Desulfatibacillum aliphaticivorans TaxID=218208 RepID=UPI000427F689|nr:TetR/AcrR family transcriptional regulator [Desulfatibacillum aliphaticivorans]
MGNRKAASTAGQKAPTPYQRTQSTPKGKIKLAMALEELLAEKDFNSITTAEISRVSGVNESLIYRYFSDKRGLLHYVLAEHQKKSLQQFYTDLVAVSGALQKLRKLIWRTLDNWNKDRIHAKILLIEVRNFPGYYDSETYLIVKEYCGLILSIVQEGIKNGEILNDVSPWFLMQAILGTVEHVVLPSLLFDRSIDPEAFTDNIIRTVFGPVAANM